MPVSLEFAESNLSQRRRLRDLVAPLDARMLATRLPNGWSVPGALAHPAFRDRRHDAPPSKE